MINLLIAVCTCKRPIMLHNCLTSIISTQLPHDCNVSLAVIDNDIEQKAKPVVAKIKTVSPIAIHYVHEPRRGIPFARNKALNFAAEAHDDYLVFIDDDEIATENWLVSLFAYALRKEGRAVIHGRVIYECPLNAPKHLAPFFTEKKFKATGQPLTSCATDNVLIPLALVKKFHLQFDEARPLAGGTDTIFFCAAHEKGIEISACSEAVVIEHVPLERINIRWLSRRKFRVGIDMRNRKIRNGKAVMTCAGSATLQLLFRLLSTGLLHLLRQRHRATKEWLKLCRCAGSIYGLLDRKVDSYQSIDGH